MPGPRLLHLVVLPPLLQAKDLPPLESDLCHDAVAYVQRGIRGNDWSITPRNEPKERRSTTSELRSFMVPPDCRAGTIGQHFKRGSKLLQNLSLWCALGDALSHIPPE